MWTGLHVYTPRFLVPFERLGNMRSVSTNPPVRRPWWVSLNSIPYPEDVYPHIYVYVYNFYTHAQTKTGHRIYFRCGDTGKTFPPFPVFSCSAEIRSHKTRTDPMYTVEWGEVRSNFARNIRRRWCSSPRGFAGKFLQKRI